MWIVGGNVVKLFTDVPFFSCGRTPDSPGHTDKRLGNTAMTAGKNVLEQCAVLVVVVFVSLAQIRVGWAKLRAADLNVRRTCRSCLRPSHRATSVPPGRGRALAALGRLVLKQREPQHPLQQLVLGFLVKFSGCRRAFETAGTFVLFCQSVDLLMSVSGGKG